MGKRQTHAGLQTSQCVTSAHEAQLDELRISNPLAASSTLVVGTTCNQNTICYISYCIELWCNGSTRDFDSHSLGSNPGSSTIRLWWNW